MLQHKAPLRAPFPEVFPEYYLPEPDQKAQPPRGAAFGGVSILCNKKSKQKYAAAAAHSLYSLRRQSQLETAQKTT